jgi:organic hydroperoxide reductase OsmC/OhrA
MQALCTASATAVGGRSGSIRSSNGVLDLKLAYPKELGGPGGAATNPEQLFAAGYAACFENALLRVARERKQPIRESGITANAAIGRNDQGFLNWRSGSRSPCQTATRPKFRSWPILPMRRSVLTPVQPVATSKSK